MVCWPTCYLPEETLARELPVSVTGFESPPWERRLQALNPEDEREHELQLGGRSFVPSRACRVGPGRPSC